MHNLAQKFFLISALQAIIQLSDARDNLECHFQIINMHLMVER